MKTLLKIVFPWRIRLGTLMCLVCSLSASAKTLTSITVLRPTTGAVVVTSTNTGWTMQFTPLCGYDDHTTDNCATSGITVSWYGDSNSLGTVNSSGLVTASGTNPPSSGSAEGMEIVAYAGSTCGSVSTCVYGHTGLLLYNPSSGSVTSIAMRPETTSTTLTLGSVGLLSTQDTSAGFPDAGRFGSFGNYTYWTTSDASKVTVDNIGQVTAVGVGSATITGYAAGQSVSRTITVTNPTLANATWYVRTNGGTDTQCNGTANTDYPGSGTGLSCAFKSAAYCFGYKDGSITGHAGAGDLCQVQAGAPFALTDKLIPPSGTPGHPTRLWGENHASCSTRDNATYSVGNRSQLVGGSAPLWLEGVQNFDMNCIDLYSGQDCYHNMSGVPFECPGGAYNDMAILVDDFTNTFTTEHVRIHGYNNNVEGTPGPGTVFTDTVSNYGAQNGYDFDNPFGYSGNRAVGFSNLNGGVYFSGFLEAMPVTVASASRDGSGHLTVTFPSGSVVAYEPSTNIVLAGMTPSDLNGTYPVSSITFNQQTVTVTGGTITDGTGTGNVAQAVFTTSAAPAFGVGSYIHCTGVAPSYIDLYGYEVQGVTSTGFTVFVSKITRPGWTTSGTISSGGTCSTASSLVATAAGSSESATVMGTASYVTPAHRGMDQQDGAFAEGDAVGTGATTIGNWTSVGSIYHRPTQDAWDMAHSTMPVSTFTGNYADGAQGAAFKMGYADSMTITNNQGVCNSGVNMAFDPNLPPDYNQYLSMFWRAGDCTPLNEYAWQSVFYVNNTLQGSQGNLVDNGCASPNGCSGQLSWPTYIMQNNVFVGYKDTNNVTLGTNYPAFYSTDPVPGASDASWVWSNNIGFQGRGTQGGASNNWSLNPSLTAIIPDITSFAAEANALPGNYTLTLNAGSPAIGAGVQNVYTPSTDYAGVTRPNPPSIGAYELGGSPPLAPTQLSGTLFLNGVLVLQ